MLPNYILVVLGDRMEMAHSVEGRVPFLDHDVVECLRDMPVALKIRGMTEKYVLREATRDVITDTVYRRQKHPFFAHRDVVTVIRAAGMNHVNVAGFSGGCKTAVWLAAETPALVRRAVLVAPPGLGVVPMPRDVLWPFFEQLTRDKSAPPVLESWLTEKLGHAVTPETYRSSAPDLVRRGEQIERA